MAIKHHSRHQTGQVAVESILLIFVLLSLTLFVMREMKKIDYISSLVQRPWSTLAGMIESGIWAKGGVVSARQQHPIFRRLSSSPIEGKEP
jgi:hypothetical protein